MSNAKGTRASVDDQGMRPRARSGATRPLTAPHSGTTSDGTRSREVSHLQAPLEVQPLPGPALKPGHQRFVLTDPAAFKYLEDDPSTTVLERRRELYGYECYVVEQWTTSRTHPTFVITTYTGNESNLVVVGVLSVPTDESTWSPRLRVYFKAINQYHARRQETPLGILMVTNLSGFPSSLTVIPVPNGDIRKHRFDFFVNENLKRLGCSGRVGLTMQPPSTATISKFHQLYRTSEKNELYKSVIELVKLAQSALMLFDKLEVDYSDGLLCDVTERAITDWWVEIGTDHYNTEPHDGILGPTTVAGLLGLLMGARNRLHAVGAPVGKDPFDVDSMKRGIGHFQKQQRITRTRRLDRRTLDRLHKATQKAAEHGGWSMPKVLKNTAAELSGKGGEMLVDAVGHRDRASIAEIETCDMERFVELIFGKTCKWLWRGKPMKKNKQESDGRHRLESNAALNSGLVFRHDQQGGFTWTARKSIAQGALPDDREMGDEVGSNADSDEQEEPKSGIMKRATGLPKAGLGKFKGAVGLKGHQHKVSMADNDSPVTPTTPVHDTAQAKKRPRFRRAHSSPLSSPTSPKSPPIDSRLEPVDELQHIRTADDLGPKDMRVSNVPFLGHSADASRTSLDVPPSYRDQHDSGGSGKHTGSSEQTSAQQSQTVTAEPSVAGSIYNGVDMNEVLPGGPETEKDVNQLLRRTLSLSHFISVQLEQHNDDGYPRHLSFSLAEDSVLTWSSVIPTGDDEDDEDEEYGPLDNDLRAQLIQQTLLTKQNQALHASLQQLQTTTSPWTQTQLSVLTTLLASTDTNGETLHEIHDPLVDQVQALQAHSESILRSEKERLEEGSKEIETFAAKLEYELNGLRGRVEDVEQGVNDFEKGVREVEQRVEGLEKQAGKQGGWFGDCCVS
ncbi:hypothetical protein LTR78_006030 [Recurvomyces mirabilis]|uniref:STB6-like N-terminal domain-containing protein n=1 Tax=Recurvomyces mirabilis TaxID=574656 RepID=A0AAE1C0Q9_9PEZI|nr:hypothetical protein LTR78_006030 [Recurvomyces mirabilis]KAK5155159.1 hypothetical protein LTS14_006114 [Recurvomyces mirabilis]